MKAKDCSMRRTVLVCDCKRYLDTTSGPLGAFTLSLMEASLYISHKNIILGLKVPQCSDLFVPQQPINSLPISVFVFYIHKLSS